MELWQFYSHLMPIYPKNNEKMEISQPLGLKIKMQFYSFENSILDFSFDLFWGIQCFKLLFSYKNANKCDFLPIGNKER